MNKIVSSFFFYLPAKSQVNFNPECYYLLATCLGNKLSVYESKIGDE